MIRGLRHAAVSRMIGDCWQRYGRKHLRPSLSTSPSLSLLVKAKVKCTFVHALRLCTGRKAHRGSRGIALLFHDHGTRRGWGVSVKPRPFFTPGKDPVHIVQEAGWASGPVWTGAENLSSTGIRSPDRPARSQSLYLLSYPAHIVSVGLRKITKTLGKFAVRGRCSNRAPSDLKLESVLLH
jgi:hypothetical protein